MLAGHDARGEHQRDLVIAASEDGGSVRRDAVPDQVPGDRRETGIGQAIRQPRVVGQQREDGFAGHGPFDRRVQRGGNLGNQRCRVAGTATVRDGAGRIDGE